MKTKAYFSTIFAILFGVIPYLNGQEFFKIYTNISTHQSQFWTKIQAIYEIPGQGYSIPHVNITDTGIYSGLRWMEVDSNGEETNFQMFSPPTGFYYWFHSFNLLKDYQYLRIVVFDSADSLVLTKYTVTNEVIWEKSFPNARYSGFMTSDKFDDLWLLYKTDSISGDSLQLVKMTKDGDLIWQSKFEGAYDLEAYYPWQLKDNFVTTQMGRIVFQNRKFAEQYWGIISVKNDGQLNWVYDTLPGVALYPLAVGIDESTLILAKDATDHEDLFRINQQGQRDKNISISDSTGWENPKILGAVARKGGDYVLLTSVKDTLKALHIRPDGSFGQQWQQISTANNPGGKFEYHAGLEDIEGNVLFTGFRYPYCFLTKLSPIESFPSSTLVKMEKKTAFQLYPNPASDKIIVSYASTNNSKSVQIVLYNTLGEKVLSQMLNHSEAEIQLKGLPKGMYFISLYEAGSILATERFFIM